MHHKARKQLMRKLNFVKEGANYYFDGKKTIHFEGNKYYLEEIPFNFTGKEPEEIVTEIFRKGLENGKTAKAKEILDALKI